MSVSHLAIGGLRQKTVAVQLAGADVFLVPSSEVDEALSKASGDLQVIGVDSLDDALTAAAHAIRPNTPLVVGGRSAGARSACRCATALGASGVLAISFPLHPPGRPEKSRVHELTGAGVPTLVVQGERDAMGRPEEFPEGTELMVVPYADHGLKVPKTADVSAEDVAAMLVEGTLEWVVREVAGPGVG